MGVAFLNCGYEQESLVKHCHTRFSKKSLGFYQISMILIHKAFLQALILKQDLSGDTKSCIDTITRRPSQKTSKLDVMCWAHTNFSHHNLSDPKDTATLNILFRCACMWSHKSEPGRCKNPEFILVNKNNQNVNCAAT